MMFRISKLSIYGYICICIKSLVRSEKNLEKYAKMEAFAKEHGIDFYPAGRGIGHQILIEEGYAWPQSLVVASDSHSNMYGGVGCLGTPIGMSILFLTITLNFA